MSVIHQDNFMYIHVLSKADLQNASESTINRVKMAPLRKQSWIKASRDNAI